MGYECSAPYTPIGYRTVLPKKKHHRPTLYRRCTPTLYRRCTSTDSCPSLVHCCCTPLQSSFDRRARNSAVRRPAAVHDGVRWTRTDRRWSIIHNPARLGLIASHVRHCSVRTETRSDRGGPVHCCTALSIVVSYGLFLLGVLPTQA